ncbi:MAG: 3-hydroxyacyl-CoA dehydrogenase/enoyl-CoA hydratase/3-hydroxybutyryl-CoA epimerase, partial [Cognaticolwellia sp.]
MQLLQTETIQSTLQGGVLTLVLNDEKQSANTMRTQFVLDYGQMVAWILEHDISGVILTSAKSSFFAGGDLKELLAATAQDAPQILASTLRLQTHMCALETWGKPVVAVMGGTALGGGLELALACHRRIGVTNPKARFGLPEVTLGLLPGGGGTVRTVRMLGVVQALMQVLLKGPQMRMDKAQSLGLIDEILPDNNSAMASARAWIASTPRSEQPWRAKGYRIPGGGKQLAQFLPAIPATLKSQLKGAHYDAPHHIVSVAVNSAKAPIERAWEIEARAFADLVCNSQQSKNMTQAFFFDLQAVNKGASRPKGFERSKVSKVAVLGAGMMGAGIAYACAKAGIQVVLKDVDLAGAERGKGYSEKLVAKAVDRKHMNEVAAAALLGRIQPSDSYADLADCELVIEAVFESTELKAKVFQAAQVVLPKTALLASNT